MPRLIGIDNITCVLVCYYDKGVSRAGPWSGSAERA